MQIINIIINIWKTIQMITFQMDKYKCFPQKRRSLLRTRALPRDAAPSADNPVSREAVVSFGAQAPRWLDYLSGVLLSFYRLETMDEGALSRLGLCASSQARTRSRPDRGGPRHRGLTLLGCSAPLSIASWSFISLLHFIRIF